MTSLSSCELVLPASCPVTLTTWLVVVVVVDLVTVLRLNLDGFLVDQAYLHQVLHPMRDDYWDQHQVAHYREPVAAACLLVAAVVVVVGLTLSLDIDCCLHPVLLRQRVHLGPCDIGCYQADRQLHPPHTVVK